MDTLQTETLRKTYHYRARHRSYARPFVAKIRAQEPALIILLFKEQP
jgi:hypothetical protein